MLWSLTESARQHQQCAIGAVTVPRFMNWLEMSAKAVSSPGVVGGGAPGEYPAVMRSCRRWPNWGAHV